MSKIDIEFAELHSPLFIKTGEKSGKNLGQKLSDNHHKGLTLAYDREHEELLVSYGDRTAIVPKHNVASMWEAETGDKPVTGNIIVSKEKPVPTFQAQVSTPQSHVHAGPGHGKTK